MSDGLQSTPGSWLLSRPVWIVVGVLVSIALVAVVVIRFWPVDPYDLRRADWRLFKERFVEPEGRVVDTGNENVSHTEGQGYGMLLAVAFNDRRTFDSMWSWTQENLKRPEDAFFAWRWSPEDGGKITDPNTASDGDLLIAWALLRAFERWQNFDYQRDAGVILTELQRRAVVETGIGLQMIPGQIGFVFQNGVMFNPSYAIFPAYQELKETFPSPAWQELLDGGEQLIERSRFGKWQLCPDWVMVSGDSVELAPDKKPEFGYDAIRVPLHIAWYDPNSPLLKPFAEFWEHLPESAPPPATVNLIDNSFGPFPALPGMVAVAQFTKAAAAGRAMTVADVLPVDREELYYSASLKMLTMLAIHERRPAK